MKIALITDTHFGARNDNLFFNDYFYKFWDNVFFPYVKDNNIKTCIHLGDLMDRRKYVSFKTAKELLYDLYDLNNEGKLSKDYLINYNN